MIDSEIIDFIGVKEYYKHYKRFFVRVNKQIGLSQAKVLKALNKDLESQGQPTVSLSYVKRNWNQ